MTSGRFDGVKRFEDEGEAGLLDRRPGKASGRRVSIDRGDEIEALYRERYQGFTAKHFTSIWWRGTSSRGATPGRRPFLHSKELLEKARRRGAHRRKRPRRPLPGMMLHQDGSRHAWLEGQPALDLIVTLDDATSAIYSAFLVEEEGTASTLRALKEIFGAHGLDEMPESLGAEDGQRRGDSVENALDVDIDRLAPIFDAQIVEGGNRTPALLTRTSSARNCSRASLTRPDRSPRRLTSVHVNRAKPRSPGRLATQQGLSVAQASH